MVIPARLGIIGCGGYAFQLIKRIWTLPREARLVAATSRDPKSSEATVAREHGVRIFSTLEEMLAFAPGQIDAILNPTPIHVHGATTRQCLEAGFPVWLEKPPFATLAEHDELAAISLATGQAIDVCFNSIYSFRVQELKAELVAGRYGTVRRIRGIGAWARDATYWSRAEWAGQLKSGTKWIYDGTINNPLAHLVCNNLYFAAREHHALAEPAEIEAHLWRANNIESEDTSSLRIVTKDGVEILSHLTLCPDDGDIPPVTVIDAEFATISLHDFQTVKIIWHDSRSETRESYKENRIEMLEFLCRRFKHGGLPLCPLSMIRPFTDVINRAFEQVLERNAGTIPTVSADQIETRGQSAQKFNAVRGINARILKAHNSGTVIAPLTLTKAG